jgi:hypothetical protein
MLIAPTLKSMASEVKESHISVVGSGVSTPIPGGRVKVVDIGALLS